jgi:hypothetical protein
VLEHDLPLAGIFSTLPSLEGEVRPQLLVLCPSPNRAEAKGRQSSVYLAQEAPDTLSVASSGGPEVFQALLGDDQLLHLPLLGCQLSLLVPQRGIPGICVKLTG